MRQPTLFSLLAGHFSRAFCVTTCCTAAGLLSHAESPALQAARQLNEAFIEVADKVSPAVVVIEIAHRAGYSDEDDLDNPLLEMLPPDVRRHYQHRDGQPPDPHRRRSPVYDGRGSGMLIRDDGWILTNNHVVEGAERIRVKLRDGRTYDADNQWWTDPQSDIAVIKINAHGLPTVRLADSAQTRVGEFAIAIGAPFELDYSVTFGHVSAKGRSHVIESRPGASMDQDFIQTDASINPGNSGGPLVNIDGDVIGVNTLIRGLNRGIGFAIPSNLAREISDHLIAERKFSRAWLGVQIRALAEDTDFREIVPGVTDGVIVEKIMPDGPSAKSGLKPADVITEVDGRTVSTAQQLRNEIRLKPIGSSVALAVLRPDGLGQAQHLTLQLRTEEWPEPSASHAAHRAPKVEPVAAPTPVGLKVEKLTKELASKFNIGLADGVVVTDVEPNSLAAQQWIQPGDIITEVNAKRITTVKDYRDATKGSPKRLMVQLLSNGAPEFRILKDSGD